MLNVLKMMYQVMACLKDFHLFSVSLRRKTANSIFVLEEKRKVFSKYSPAAI